MKKNCFVSPSLAVVGLEAESVTVGCTAATPTDTVFDVPVSKLPAAWSLTVAVIVAGVVSGLLKVTVKVPVPAVVLARLAGLNVA